MSLTLLALLLAPFYLKVVLDPAGTEKFIKSLNSDHSLRWVFAFFYFLLATFILSTTGFVFEFTWGSLLAWIGLLVYLKGLVFLLPNVYEKIVKFYGTKNLAVWGFIGLLFALALVYIDTQVI